jgi:hypothetical protein
VKARELGWKLRRLEEKMSDDVSISGTTRIDWDCLTEKERVLLDKVCEIRDRYAPSLPPDDVLAENFELFAKGIQLFARRATDLFVSVLSKSFCGDGVEEWFFKLHFYNFMMDLFDCIENVKKWSKIGLGEFLVRETLPKADAKVVEVPVVMAEYNPFYEKAGMLGVDYQRGRSSLEEQIRPFVEAQGFDFALGKSRAYCRGFFERLDVRSREELLSEFAKPPFIKNDTVSPELLTRMFSTDKTYLYWIRNSPSVDN